MSFETEANIALKGITFSLPEYLDARLRRPRLQRELDDNGPPHSLSQLCTAGWTSFGIAPHQPN